MSPWVILTLLIPRKDGTWRMCTKILEINRIIIKYKFHIPHVKDMLDELVGAKYFSMIDLQSEHYQIYKCEGDEWKITLKIWDELYK